MTCTGEKEGRRGGRVSFVCPCVSGIFLIFLLLFYLVLVRSHPSSLLHTSTGARAQLSSFASGACSYINPESQPGRQQTRDGGSMGDRKNSSIREGGREGGE